MAEVFTYDSTPSTEVMSAINADEAESLAIGEELEAQHEGMLAGKYKSAQELEQAYMELEKKLGSPERSEEVEVEEEVSQDEEGYSSEFADLMYQAGNEYSEKGELSPETLEAFSGMSSQDLVQAYFEMQSQGGNEPQGRDMSDAEVNQIQNSVGGQEAYQQLTTWAADNFSPAEIEAFDSLVESGNTPAIQLALQALYYRYTDAMGSEGEMLQGKPAAAQSTFRSQAELVQAMSDPRYDNDPAYRQDVIQKLERSDIEF